MIVATILFCITYIPLTIIIFKALKEWNDTYNQKGD